MRTGWHKYTQTKADDGRRRHCSQWNWFENKHFQSENEETNYRSQIELECTSGTVVSILCCHFFVLSPFVCNISFLGYLVHRPSIPHFIAMPHRSVLDLIALNRFASAYMYMIWPLYVYSISPHSTQHLCQIFRCSNVPEFFSFFLSFSNSHFRHSPKNILFVNDVIAVLLRIVSRWQNTKMHFSFTWIACGISRRHPNMELGYESTVRRYSMAMAMAERLDTGATMDCDHGPPIFLIIKIY